MATFNNLLFFCTGAVVCIGGGCWGAWVLFSGAMADILKYNKYFVKIQWHTNI